MEYDQLSNAGVLSGKVCKRKMYLLINTLFNNELLLHMYLPLNLHTPINSLSYPASFTLPFYLPKSSADNDADDTPSDCQDPKNYLTSSAEYLSLAPSKWKTYLL